MEERLPLIINVFDKSLIKIPLRFYHDNGPWGLSHLLDFKPPFRKVLLVILRLWNRR